MTWWQIVLLILAGLANFGPGPIAFMRTTRRGDRYLRDLGDDDGASSSCSTTGTS